MKILKKLRENIDLKVFFFSVLIIGLISFGLTFIINLNWWICISIVVFAMFINGILATWEDEQPGGFHNPQNPISPVEWEGSLDEVRDIKDLKKKVINSPKKYKRIKSCIHNAGHSFLSLMNYVDGEYIIDILPDLFKQQDTNEILINLSDGSVEGLTEVPEKLKKSIQLYKAWLPRHIISHQISTDIVNNVSLRITPASLLSATAKYGLDCDVECTDDRGVSHKKRVMINS